MASSQAAKVRGQCVRQERRTTLSEVTLLYIRQMQNVRVPAVEIELSRPDQAVHLAKTGKADRRYISFT